MKTHERPTTKQCSKCGHWKTFLDFYEKSLSRQCKSCQLERSKTNYQKNKKQVTTRIAKYKKENQQKIKLYLQSWYLENKDRILNRCKEYNALPEVKERERIRQSAKYAENRDAIQASRRSFYEKNLEAKKRFDEYQKSYYKENKHVFNARGAKRRAVKKHAFPLWADAKAIARFYVLAKQKTRDTGIKHVVDHIVPLQGRKVCGLHVEANLQVIPEKENLQKFNKFG